jgi:hypothetical protein
MKKILLASVALAGMATSAMAGPLSPQTPAADSGWVTRVARFNCIRDDRGWHYMRGERRTVCRPDRPRADVKFYGWRCEGPRCGWWHKRDKRWHDG